MDGHRVVMVSSGDPGVYGMAGVVLEVAAKEKASVPVEIVPGVTAATAAAPPLRILSLEPDCDPFHAEPQRILVIFGKYKWRLDIHPYRGLLVNLRALLERYDPDLLITAWGDTWLLPHLLELARETGLPLPLNRDPDAPIGHKKERSYFSYGRVVYRGQQVLLSGRLHVDGNNAVLFHEYGLRGSSSWPRDRTLRPDRGACLARHGHLVHADRDRPETRRAHPISQTTGGKPEECPGPAAQRPGRPGLPAAGRDLPLGGLPPLHAGQPDIGGEPLLRRIPERGGQGPRHRPSSA